MKLLSPAKINLFLHVFGKRKDGFHDIETLFERVSLCDEITFERARSDIHLSCKALPIGRRNLVYRAAQLLKERYRVRAGVRIQVKKNIPVSAGLGGGSSNAATTLIALNRLWRLRLSKSQLCRIGAELGSDVPFFILEKPFAVAKGRGEILRPLSGMTPKIWHCIVKPPFGISTREAYLALDTDTAHRAPTFLTPKNANVRMLLHSIQKGDSDAIRKRLINSLELSLNKRVTSIFEIKKKLSDLGALGALLSGSGSAVFGIFASEKKAKHAARILKKKSRWKVFVASTY